MLVLILTLLHVHVNKWLLSKFHLKNWAIRRTWRSAGQLKCIEQRFTIPQMLLYSLFCAVPAYLTFKTRVINSYFTLIL